MVRDLPEAAQPEPEELRSHTSGTASTRTKILAYLGQVRRGEFIPAKKLIADLGLRFTTAKNALTQLEEDWIVEKRITTRRGTRAEFRIDPRAKQLRQQESIAKDRGTGATNDMNESDFVPFMPPEWESSYGQHPYGI